MILENTVEKNINILSKLNSLTLLIWYNSNYGSEY
jgi:hypothetical protein